MVSAARNVEGGETVVGVEWVTLKLEKGEEYILLQREVRNADEQNTSYSLLTTSDRKFTGLVLKDDYVDVALNQSKYLKSMQSNPREVSWEAGQVGVSLFGPVCSIHRAIRMNG